MLRAVFVVVLCGMVALAADASAAESRLSASAIRQLLADHTVTILVPRLKTAPLLLAHGGTLRRGDGGHEAAGKWSIRRNRLCLDIAGTADRGCMTVVRRSEDKKHLFLFTRAGEPSGELNLDSETR